MTNEELFSKYIESEKNPIYLEKLVNNNIGAIADIAKMFCTAYDDIEDFIQAGKLGFVQSVNRYDPSKGCMLITYAIPWIKMEIHKATELRFNMRVPSHIQTKSNRGDDRSIDIMTAAISSHTTSIVLQDGSVCDKIDNATARKDSNISTVENSMILDELVGLCTKLTDFQKAVMSNKFDYNFCHELEYDLMYVSPSRLRTIEQHSLNMVRKISLAIDFPG